MIVKCQNCGSNIEINGIGRPNKGIPVNKIVDALQAGCRDGRCHKDGTINYSAAADYLINTLDVDISRGYVHGWVTNEADKRGISRDQLVDWLLKRETT